MHWLGFVSCASANIEPCSAESAKKSHKTPNRNPSTRNSRCPTTGARSTYPYPECSDLKRLDRYDVAGVSDYNDFFVFEDQLSECMGVRLYSTHAFDH